MFLVAWARFVFQGLPGKNTGIILGLYWDNGKGNGNCYNGLYSSEMCEKDVREDTLLHP